MQVGIVKDVFRYLQEERCLCGNALIFNMVLYYWCLIDVVDLNGENVKCPQGKGVCGRNLDIKRLNIFIAWCTT